MQSHRGREEKEDMPREKSAKKPKTEKAERLEDVLMSCRNHLRGRAPMTDKRDLLLTLVFLKFVGDRFEAQRHKISEQFADKPDFLKIALEQESFYGQDGILFLPESCRWELLSALEPAKMAVAFDNAISELEQGQANLKNALPRQIFTKTALEPSVLKSVVDDISKIDPARFGGRDLIGRVYEYFLQAFSINADKEEGEFYTPHSVVELIAALIEPWDGTIYDPCCGSGGMFVQCARLIEERGGDTRGVNVYGQESEPATYRLAKMNLAVRGLSYHLGDRAASSFTDDQHKGLRVDCVMANPPFNLKKWRGPDELKDDFRWRGYAVPPESNANYAWILHILSKLKDRVGRAGFLLANGALDDSDTLAIRRKLLENDKVEAIIVLPREMFYSTDISVTLWLLSNDKSGGPWHGRRLRDRRGEVLFVDLRTWNGNIYEKKFVRFSDEQIGRVRDILEAWRTAKGAADGYAEPELFRAVTLAEIANTDFSLVPSRYIEFVDRDSALDWRTALRDAGTATEALLQRQEANARALREALAELGVKR